MRKKGIALIVTFIVIFSIHTSVFADNEFNFSDMKNHWSVEYVEELYNKGIITGYPDETFKPNNNVSRAEAIKMLTVATGEDVGSNKDGYWADNYIRQAISIGYVLEGEFDDYNKPMSRLELAKIIVRAIDEEYTPNMNEYSKQITDYDTIDDKDKEYVLKAFVKGIITGYPDGAFKPDNNVTRAEASTMLVRLLNSDKRKAPKVIKDNVIEIDGQEVKVARKDTVEVFNKAANVLRNGGKHTIEVYNEYDTVRIYYTSSKDATKFEAMMSFYSNTKRENALDSDNAIVVNEHTEETNKLTKAILKAIFPTGYEKIYKEFENVTYKGTEKSGKYDGRTYTVKSFPTETGIFIGGK